MSLSSLFLGVALLALFQGSGVSSEVVPRMGFLGLHGGVFGQLESVAEDAGVQVVSLDELLFAGEDLGLAELDAVFIQHLRGDAARELGSALSAARETNPEQHAFSISGIFDQLLPDQTSAGILQRDPQIEDYYREGGAENMRRLLRYAAITYVDGEGTVEPPLVAPPGVLFHPDFDGPFADVEDLRGWLRGRGLGQRPLVAVAVHRIHRVVQQPRVLQAVVKALEEHGLAVVALEDNSGLYRETIQDLGVALVVHLCHSFDDIGLRKELGVPHLHSMFFRRDSIEEWKASGSGLDAQTMAFQIVSQELLGAIEPQVGAGTLRGHNSTEAFEPIHERIEHLAARAAAWVRLGQTPNAQKKIALLYYNREMGKADMMRGSATGMFMNAPRSLMAVLRRMAGEGYAMARIPQDEHQLLARMLDHGQQIGAWAPDELDRVARSGHAVLIPVDVYQRWLREKVPAKNVEALEKSWGPAPGRIQVWQREDGERFLVLPRVELGDGVVLLPQPLRGEAHDTSLAHDLRVPPSHNYLATYFWLQEEYAADALIHFGTHGTEFLLPGKATGLGEDDWPDLILGQMPNITPWVINNLGESSPARRRAYAVLIDHQVPPSVQAGLDDELLSLHDDIDKWEGLAQGTLKQKFRSSITEQTKALHLDRDLHLPSLEGRSLDPQELDAISAYLHEIHNETIPVSLHTFGEALDEELLVPYLVTCLRRPFLEALGGVFDVPGVEDRFGGDRDKYLRARAEEVLELFVHRDLTASEAIQACGGRVGPQGLGEELLASFDLASELRTGLLAAGDEMDGLMAALDGKFVAPGPGGAPDRNPGVLPTGRNMVTMNPEEIPSRPSWEVGVQLVDDLLAGQLALRDRYPLKVGFTLNSFATFQDYGVMEAQILYLMGIRPVWDSRNIVAELEVMTLEELGRPRIDVFLASGSYYRDMLPTRMRLLDRAIRMVAELDEPGNALRANSLRVERELQEQGVAPDEARALSLARIFGYPPGQSGSAGYYYLVERSGEWDTKEDLMATYLDHVRFVYTDGLWGESAAQAYERQIQGTEVLLRSWSDRTRSPLSNKYDWFKAGSLSRAVELLTGKEPQFFFSDVRDPDRARMVVAEDALRQDYRVRLFNRKWLEGMMEEGFAGADQLSKHVSNTMGWAIMRNDAVSDDIWEEIVSTLVDDRLELGLREWFEEQNPFAYQELTEILLESIRKGYWDASPEMRAKLAAEYAASVRAHGEGGGMLGGGNVKLDAFVEELLAAPGAGEVVARVEASASGSGQASAARSAPATQPAAELDPANEARALEQVRGRELERVESAQTQAGNDEHPLMLWLVGAASLFLILAGFFTRRGTPG